MSQSLSKTIKTESNLPTVLTPQQHRTLQAQFKRASNRMRAEIVTTWHLQGLDVKRMAKMLGITEAEVQRRLDEAIEEARAEMHLVPEGPLLMTQIIGEGYSRLNSQLLAIAHKRLEKLLGDDVSAEDVNDGVVQSYMRLMLDVNDRMADRMERLGVTTAPEKGPKIKPGPEVPVDPLAALVAALEKQGANGGVRKAIENSVEPREVEDELSSDKDEFVLDEEPDEGMETLP